MRGSIRDLILRYPALAAAEEDILKAIAALLRGFGNGNKLLVCGNGGSAADADHIVGELMKGFCKKRRLGDGLSGKLAELGGEAGHYLAEHLQGALPAISLAQHHALSTAIANDMDPALVFAQQVLGYGKNGDMLLAISTSGNSRNIVYAAITAKILGMTVIGLTGQSPGELGRHSDICISAPGTETYRIQELHLPIYHAICLSLEEELFG